MSVGVGGTAAVVAWLVDGARSTQAPDQVLADLCDRLIQCGIPLWRVAVFVRTLHPQVMGRRFVWRHGQGTTVMEAPHELLETEDFRTSPMAQVYAGAVSVRRRLADPGCVIDFPILSELQAEGVTDYLVSPLIFSDGAIHAVTWTTRRPGGFTHSQIAAIESILAPFARVAEIRALRRTASSLLDTYVGNQAGERILSGHIRRGDTQSIDAAIWLSDMRGFTSLADRVPPELLIELLNRYFDCQVPAIVDHGGEVLKFMGDGLLAIFPVPSNDDAEVGRVCRHALSAATLARAKIAELGGASDAGSVGGVRFGLALHIGRVLYGNIGGGNRLDFTCIGPAVNMAARIEKLAGKLGRTILTSGEFAQYSGDRLKPLGDFSLQGFRGMKTVFGLAEEGGYRGNPGDGP
jgi:adenylate cyclase